MESNAAGEYVLKQEGPHEVLIYDRLLEIGLTSSC